MHRRFRFTFLAATVLVCLLTAGGVFAADISYPDAVERAGKCAVSDDTVGLVAKSVESGALTESDASGLLSPLLEACAEKMPLSQFEDKLAEGLAKHVAPLRIRGVLERKLKSYRFVKGLLPEQGGENHGELLAVLGEGAASGVPHADIESYVNKFQGQSDGPFLTGAHMVSLLGQFGFDYALTRSMLETAFAAGGPSAEWRYFIRVVLIARQRGLSDGDVASAARRVLGANGSLADISARLGFTVRNLTGRADSN